MSLHLYQQKNEWGPKVDPQRCRVAVHNGRPGFRQCSHKATAQIEHEGESVGVCRTHHPDTIAARGAAKQQRWGELAKRERNIRVGSGLREATDDELAAECARRGWTITKGEERG